MSKTQLLFSMNYYLEAVDLTIGIANPVKKSNRHENPMFIMASV
jgi:hypothetical protein